MSIFAPPFISLLIDLLTGRLFGFSTPQAGFYVLSMVGSLAFWWAITWGTATLLRHHPRANVVLATLISAIYALNFVLVYGYYFLVGILPNYFIFEYMVEEPFNSWTLLTDSWRWYHWAVLVLATVPITLVFLRWQKLTAMKSRPKLRRWVAATAVALAFTIQLVIHNNIRFIDQCFTADMTTSTGFMRSFYVTFFPQKSGQSGLLARAPAILPDLSGHIRHLPDGRPLNVLIILNESLRADELGVYGYHRNTTPFLDSLIAARGDAVIKYDRAITASSMTFMSVPSMVTSVAPIAPARFYHTQPLYWEYFKALGYETFFITSQSHAWHNVHLYFHVPAIDEYYNMEIAGVGRENDLGMDDRFATTHFLEWFHHRPIDRPFAGLLQFNQTHYPYATDETNQPFGVEELRDKYDNALSYVDRQCRRVFQALDSAGALENTVIVMTSDHGEGFKEHGVLGHLNCFYREGILVPYLWFLPKALVNSSEWHEAIAPMRENTHGNVSNLDILPTLLDFAGLGRAPELDVYRPEFAGQSLLSPISPGRPLICSNLTEAARQHGWTSVIAGDWHYTIVAQGAKSGMQELYNWSNDPGETANLFGTADTSVIRQMCGVLARYPVSRNVLHGLGIPCADTALARSDSLGRHGQ